MGEVPRDEIDDMLKRASRQIEVAPSRLATSIEQQQGVLWRRRVIGRAMIAAAATACVVVVLAMTPRIGFFAKPEHADAVVQEETATRQSPPVAGTDQSIAKVKIASAANVIVLPIESKERNVSIAWFYPTAKGKTAAQQISNEDLK